MSTTEAIHNALTIGGDEWRIRYEIMMALASHLEKANQQQLAFHAPPVPDWFEPTMPNRPTADYRWQWCQGCKADSDCEHTADCDKLRAFHTALTDWNCTKDTQRLAQWPWKYANLVMLAQPKEP